MSINEMNMVMKVNNMQNGGNDYYRWHRNLFIIDYYYYYLKTEYNDWITKYKSNLNQRH